MTYTGLSCAEKRKTNKHGCSASVRYFCSVSGKYIDPMTCHNDCKSFKTLASLHERPARSTTETHLL